MTTPKDSKLEDMEQRRFERLSDLTNTDDANSSQSIKNSGISWNSFNYGMFWGVVIGTTAIASASLGAALSTIPKVNHLIITKLAQNGFNRYQAEVKSIVTENLTQPTTILVVETHSPESNYLADTIKDRQDSILLWQLQPKQQSAKVTLIAAERQVFIPALGWIPIQDALNYGGINLLAQTINQIVEGVTINHYISATPKAMKVLAKATENVTSSQCQFTVNTQLPYTNPLENCTTNLNKFQQQEIAIAALHQNLNNHQLASQIDRAFPQIYQQLNTDLSGSEMLALIDYVRTIPSDNLHVSLPPKYLQEPQKLVSSNSQGSANLPKNSQSFLDSSESKLNSGYYSDNHPFNHVTIAIQNTTDTPELAAKAIGYLEQRNFGNVYLVNYLPLNLEKTEIILPQSKIRTAQHLRQTLGVGQLRLAEDKSLEAILIRIGKDAKYLTIEDNFIR